MMRPAIFELEPIGVGGQLEAVYTHRFCSTECLDHFKGTGQLRDVPTADGEDDGALPDEHCTMCGQDIG